MKGIYIFCASHAATAIRLSTMDEGSSSSSSSSSTTHLGSGRAIDRYNPIIRDERRLLRSLIPPCSNPQPPINPKPHHHHHHKNSKESGGGGNNTKKKKSSSSKPENDDQKRRSGSDFGEASDSGGSVMRKQGWGCTNPGGFISPPSSSRYLLSDTDRAAFLNVLSDFDPLLTLVNPVEPSKSQAVKKDESSSSKPPSSTRPPDQVVVLRVSLHCRGCERKMRKHISRMEGVTSFNIDFAAKKLTVVGDVTPLSVLASVSKVKNAQLLTPTVSTSSVPQPVAGSEIKKYQGIVV